MKELNTNNNSAIWNEYQSALDFQNSINLRSEVRQCVDFYEGRQWAAPTEETKLLPRPVVNQIEQHVANKAAGILSVPVRLVYKSFDDPKSAEIFTRFAEHIVKEQNLSTLDAENVLAGLIKGTYVYHFFWDENAVSSDGLPGGYRAETIDVRNFFPHNPAIKDEQKQKWIIISSREEVADVKAKADKGVDLDLIVPDDADDGITEEQRESKLVTVLTKYFRKDGEVFCEIATKATVVRKAFPITPEGCEKKATLYPVAVGRHKERDGSIYGRSEVEGRIPNQRLINLLLALSALKVQDFSLPKWVVKDDALGAQEITNSTQILTDYSAMGNGIRRISGEQDNGAAIKFAETLFDLNRSVSGVTEVASGEVISANMSGQAIALLQSQAQQPLKTLRDAFWKVKEKQGKILEQAFKLYYRDAEFYYSEKAEDGREIMTKATFNGSDYGKSRFSVTVEAVRGTESSTAGDIGVLDALLSRGAITPVQYVELYPTGALTDKNSLVALLKRGEEAESVQLKMQVAALTEELKKSKAELDGQTGAIDSIRTVIERDREILSWGARLYQEAFSKIKQQNEIINRESKANAAFADVIAQKAVEEGLAKDNAAREVEGQ